MADDLDELLDEIEGSLSHNESMHIPQKQEVLHSVSNEDEDIDQIIRDICSEDNPVPTKATHSQVKKIPLSPSKSRCKVLLLGGSVTAMGLCETEYPRSCDKLRCTSCDFPVMWFNDQVWNSKCDYLFFRNNMPDQNKLRKNLMRKRGCRAYACQCSWESVDKTVEVSSLNRHKWVCGRH